MTPDAAAASLVMVGELDVRDALPSVQCPTLVLRRANDTFVDPRHSRYAADHIPNAQYVEVRPDGRAVHEIEQFLTGVRRPVVSDRVLATVLFTDIVDSTKRAAELGDSGWRALLQRHDELAQTQSSVPGRRGAAMGRMSGRASPDDGGASQSSKQAA